MSMFSACCCAANEGDPLGCLGCVTDPASFRLDFSEITYKSASLTASGSWDNGTALCLAGHRSVEASREFPDISDFGDATILAREDVGDNACAWGMADAAIYGERRDNFVNTNCNCSDAVASVYGGTAVGSSYFDWNDIAAVATAQAAARPGDCGLAALCSGESRTVACGDTDHKKGVRAILSSQGGNWTLNMQWRALGTLAWREHGAFGAGHFNLKFAGNFASEDFNTQFFNSTDISSAYSNCFQSVWPDCTNSDPSHSDLQWTYTKAFDCDDLDGTPFTLTLQDQTAVNSAFDSTHVNNPPTTVTVVAL